MFKSTYKSEKRPFPWQCFRLSKLTHTCEEKKSPLYFQCLDNLNIFFLRSTIKTNGISFTPVYIYSKIEKPSQHFCSDSPQKVRHLEITFT